MSIVTAEEVEVILKDNKKYKNDWGGDYDPAYNLRYAIGSACGKDHRTICNGYEPTKTDIKAWLSAELEKLRSHRLGKGLRPWDIVNISAKLDPKQPWIGVEYETGFQTSEAYRKVVDYVWFQHNHSTIDSEGGSRYPCEITFAPVNYNDFMSDDKCPMDQLYTFLAANKISVDDNWAGDDDDYYDDDDDDGQEGCVGTHSNISTPAFRGLKVDDDRGRVVQIMNASLGILSDTSLRKLLGRRPYGGFGLRYSRGGHFIEGKLFKSTGSHEEWKAYKKTIGKFAEAIEELSVLAEDSKLDKTRPRSAGRYHGYCITNFRKFLLGEDEAIELGWREIKEDYDW